MCILSLIIGYNWRYNNIDFTCYGCANGFLGFWHAFFGWGFILRRGTYQWFWTFLGDAQVTLGILSSYVVHQPSYFIWIFFLFSFFLFLLMNFKQENYASMWGHYGSKVMGAYSRPFNEVLGSTIDLFWWYMPFIYGGLCPICFLRELKFGGSIFVF
jgi:hypothetical protein